MKVLHLVHTVRLDGGGLPAVALNLAIHQRRVGIDAHVWCFDDEKTAETVAEEHGLMGAVHAFRIQFPKMLYYSRAGSRAIVSSEAMTYDIIHQHGIWLWYSQMTQRWRAKTQKPTIVAPHGSLEAWALARSWWKKAIVLKLFERRNLENSAWLHATCEDEVASIRRFGLKNRVAILPNGVSDEMLHTEGSARRFVERFEIPPNRRIMLFLSRIHPKKGLPMLLQALNNTRDRLGNWLLLIAGIEECGHCSELRELVSRLALHEYVQFVGPLFGTNKRDALSASELFVLPTHSENFGIVIAEALACGVPVLTTTGAPWLEIRTNHCGWWVEPNVRAIQEELSKALSSSPSELIAKGARGRSMVEKKYLWPKIAESCRDLYSRIIAEPMERESVGLEGASFP